MLKIIHRKAIKTHQIRQIVEYLFRKKYGIELHIPHRRSEIFSLILSSPNKDQIVADYNSRIKDIIKKQEA